MPTLRQTAFVKSGSWRTLHTFFNATATGLFREPAGAKIKIRLGLGFLGRDRQKQTLSRDSVKTLEVSKGASLLRARMQIRVAQDIEVSYTLILPGP